MKIPAQNIIAWSKHAPWAELWQVEQDLIIARALVELFNDPFLRRSFASVAERRSTNCTSQSLIATLRGPRMFREESPR
jgi:hypothetical protein